jgi:hypothetical protein
MVENTLTWRREYNCSAVLDSNISGARRGRLPLRVRGAFERAAQTAPHQLACRSPRRRARRAALARRA